MKMFKKISFEMLLPVLFAWFMMTVLVDIITIPTVFRNSSNLVDAGKIGMIVFGRFNIIENIFAVIVLWGAVTTWQNSKKISQLFPALYLFIMSWVYTFYMTPKITETTQLIYQTAVSDPLYVSLQSQHATYHNLYRTMDSIKLFLLLAFFVWVLIIRIKSQKGPA